MYFLYITSFGFLFYLEFLHLCSRIASHKGGLWSFWYLEYHFGFPEKQAQRQKWWQDMIRHGRDLLGEMPVERSRKGRGRLKTVIRVWRLWKKREKEGFGRKALTAAQFSEGLCWAREESPNQHCPLEESCFGGRGSGKCERDGGSRLGLAVSCVLFGRTGLGFYLCSPTHVLYSLGGPTESIWCFPGPSSLLDPNVHVCVPDALRPGEAVNSFSVSAFTLEAEFASRRKAV